jgi:hypothetical protein
MNESVEQILLGMRTALSSFSPAPQVDPLDRLVGRLAGSLDALVGQADSEWIEELRSAWWQLEFINASVLGDDRLLLTVDEVRQVSESRDEFVALLTPPGRGE